MNKRISSDSADISGFSAEAYLAINEARWRIAETVLDSLARQGAAPADAYDFGCGPGWFAARLAARGLDVVGLEARMAVVEAARKAAPGARFDPFDLDAVGLANLPGPRDFSLCFGILYHLENPLRALRIVRAMTKSVALIETMTFPAAEPVARLARENDNTTQGVRDLALILSPSAIELALAASGFSHVYRHVGAIDHPDFIDRQERHRRRHVFLASSHLIEVEDFVRLGSAQMRREDYWKMS